MKLSSSSSKLLFVTAAVVLLAATAGAQSYKLESTSTPPPQEVAAPIRDMLSADALHVTGPNGALCDIWLRKSIPAAPTPDTSLGVNFGTIPQGALVGAIKFDAAGADYRGQPIKPGVYTLRFMLQPVQRQSPGRLSLSRLLLDRARGARFLTRRRFHHQFGRPQQESLRHWPSVRLEPRSWRQRPRNPPRHGSSG